MQKGARPRPTARCPEGFPAFQKKREGGLPAYPPALAQPHPPAIPGLNFTTFLDGKPGIFLKPLRRGGGFQSYLPPMQVGGVPSDPEEDGRGVAGLPPSGFRIRPRSRQPIQRLFCRGFSTEQGFLHRFPFQRRRENPVIDRGGSRPTSPPCRWGGSFASGRKREGGWPATPPYDSPIRSIPAIDDGSGTNQARPPPHRMQHAMRRAHP